MQEVLPKMGTDRDREKAYQACQAQLKQLQGHLAEACVALPLLEAQLCNAACDDPGSVVMEQVVLPLLQQRVLAGAEAFFGQHSQVVP